MFCDDKYAHVNNALQNGKGNEYSQLANHND